MELELSIVVPAYNAASTLPGCLRALLSLDIAETYEIIIVDDGSTDRTAEIAAALEPRVQLIRQAHAGASAARNRGIKAAQGSIVLFTDADCEPVREWATHLVRAIKAGAAGAKGTYRTRQRNLVAKFVQAEYESKYRHMAGREQIDFIDTYSAAYRRDALVEAGGFNESLPVDEDQELSFRLAELGYRLQFVPEAVVYHTHVTSMVAYTRRKFRIGYWKVFVGAEHPQRMVSDSHTPQGMKVEMLLAALLVPAVVTSPFSRFGRKAAGIAIAGFALLTLPFVARIAPVNPAVAAIAPAMLLLRALGLGFGLVAGTAQLGLLHVYKRKRFPVQ